MSNYGIGLAEPTSERHERKTFKVWLRDYLTRSINRKNGKRKLNPGIISDANGNSVYKFNHSFEGWNIRLHKAHDGHVVEAWRNVEVAYNSNIGKTDHQHILFLVNSSEDMGERLNHIMVELALRM